MARKSENQSALKGNYRPIAGSDEVIFAGDHTEPCNGFGPSEEEMIGSGDGSYAAIRFVDDYPEHVTLGSDNSVAILELTTGYMDLGQYVAGISV